MIEDITNDAENLTERDPRSGPDRWFAMGRRNPVLRQAAVRDN
jgi:hypothetical protein